MGSCVIRVWCSALLLVLLLYTKVTSYEKTLRKIVRNQSKMVQRPFSELTAATMLQNASINSVRYNEAFLFPGVSQGKTMYHNMQRPRISMILSTVESGKDRRTSGYSKMKFMRTGPPERMARNTVNDISASTQTQRTVIEDENMSSNNMTIKNFYQIPTVSRFFPPISERENSFEIKPPSLANTIIIPENPDVSKENETAQINSILIPKSRFQTETDDYQTKIIINNTQNIINIDTENDKVGLYIEGVPIDSKKFTYNLTVDPVTCLLVKESKPDIDAQEKFVQFDIEPPWVQEKKYWNKMFDNRYESLMRNPKWPPLKVILIPRAHVDSIWKKTFEQYHKDSVAKIILNVIKKLQFYEGLTFSWNEVSHLSHWWKTASPKNRSALRKLVKSGRLEITTGGWVEVDEATTHLFGLVHQLIEGHQWLKVHLNYTPKSAWLTHSVSHSPTMIYLLSILDINQVVFTNLHYAWEEFFAEFQYSDFIWLQNWDHDKTFPTKLNEDMNKLGNDRYPKHASLTHYLQFNSDGFKACGPDGMLCVEEFNFASFNQNLDINPYNIKAKAEKLLEQYSKTGTISQHNTMIAPIGGPYHYEVQTEFDYQYHNYLEIADYVNANKEIYKATVEFGTPQSYFKTIMDKHKHYPTIKGDFLNFADIEKRSPAYWTGFFTSRPFTKILLRRLQSTLRTTEILFSFALNFNVFRRFNLTEVFNLLLRSRESVARLVDRNVMSGTVTANTLKYVHNKILLTVKDCWYIQEISASYLTSKDDHTTPYLQKYVYRDGEFKSVFKTVSPGDHIYIFNSLSHERAEIVEIVTRFSNIRIMDHKKKDVTIQINPIWKPNCENAIKLSRKFFKISFAVVMAPMTFALYKIKETYDATQNAATLYCLACVVDNPKSDGMKFPFHIHPIQSGDIQLESYKHRLIFDEYSGFLKTVVEKETNIEKPIIIDYGAFRDSTFNSGMFLFNTNASNPLHDILMSYKLGKKPKVLLIISGRVTTELITIYGRLLQHTTKIFNLMSSPLSSAIYIESKVDYELSPKNRELEMFLSIQTDIANGNPPQIFIDNNAFQYTPRYLNLSKRIESNINPMTSMVFIQDKLSRLTCITDHAQGVTALQEGQLAIMLDRRVLFNDERGTNEGLADSSVTCNRHYILLENLLGSSKTFPHYMPQDELTLPSLSALHLSNAFNDILDVFVIQKNNTNYAFYTFLPLIRTTFPCDISILNYRALLDKGNMRYFTPTAGHMILHRQSFSCNIVSPLILRCHGDKNFIVEKILRNTKAVFQTNLAGTNDGKPIINLNLVNFPPMELTTLLIAF